MKKFCASAVLALTLLLATRVIFAHAIPFACLPRIGSTVSNPPAQLICQFSEALNPSSISLMVLDANGQRVDQNDTRFYPDDNRTLIVSLDTTKMPQGIYTVKWRVLDTTDQGVTNGEFQFGVQTIVPPTPTPVLPGVPITPPPNPPSNNSASDLIARFLIGVGVVVLLAVGVLFWRLRTSGNAEQE